MSDSATIELFRNCGSEGVKQLTCTGKQDQDYIQRELICKSEQGNPDIDGLNALNTGTLHIFEYTPSNNNNIDQFANKNLNDQMMGDQAFENKDDSLKKKKEDAEYVKITSEVPSNNIRDEIHTLVVENITESSEKTAINQITSPEARSRRETENPALSKIDNATLSTEPSSNVNTHKHDVDNSSSSQDHFLPPLLLDHHDNSTEKPSVITNITSEAIQNTRDPTLLNESISNVSSPLKEIPTSIDTEKATEPTITSTVSITIVPQISNEYPKSKWGRPHAPKFGGEISFHAPIFATMKATIELTTENVISVNDELNSTGSTTILDNSKIHNKSSTIQTPPDIYEATKTTPTINEATIVHDTVDIAKRSNGIPDINKHQRKDSEDENVEQHADFTNANIDFQRYKPNRHRILTKPETHTYIQKIFG